MNLQHSAQPRSSINGFARRRGDRETGSKSLSKMHSGKSTSSNFGSAANGGKAGGVANSSRDRLIYVWTSLIGLRVEVHVRNGSIISGIFHTTNAEKDFGVVLKMAQEIKDGSIRGPKPVLDVVKKPQDMYIQSKDIVQVVAKDVPLNIEEFTSEHAHERCKDLMIDSAISHSHHLDMERELERWTPDVDDPGCPELENIFDGAWNRSWDQFEVNEALFGVKSTFDEELYTTKLERGPQMRELEREASRIAREIEGEETHDLHLAEERGIHFNEAFNLDEEIRYSAVCRKIDDGRYEENENSFLDAHNSETFGSSEASTIPGSYSDTSQSKLIDEAQASSTCSDEESSLEIHSDKDNPLSSLANHVRPLTSGFTAKKSLLINEESRFDEKQMKNHDEDKEFLNECTERMVPEAAQISKSKEVQPSVDAKGPSLSIIARDPSSAGQDNKHSIGGSSETARSSHYSAANDPINSSLCPGTSSSASKHIGAGSVSRGPVLSPSSSVGSLSSERSTLNPNAKEFKLNPNAKSFTPSTSFRPPVPISEGPFYYGGSLSAVPPMHNIPMGMGIGPSFGGHQSVYNPQVAPIQSPQPYVHPNGPLYGQQMILGQPRPVYYMPTYPPDGDQSVPNLSLRLNIAHQNSEASDAFGRIEMPYKGRNF